MEKIKIVRESGRPVELKQIEEFEIEFKENYDRLNKSRMDGELTMIEMNEKLLGVDVQLADKYDTIKEINMPASLKDWTDLQNEYKTSIRLDMHAETDELFIVLLDMGAY